MASGGDIRDVSKLNESDKPQPSNTAKRRKKERIDTDEKEKEGFKNILVQKDSLIESLKNEISKLSTQLSTAIEGKFIALAKNDGIQNSSQSIEQKERQIEQERTLLNNQIQLLTEDLNKYQIEYRKFHTEKTALEDDFKSKLSEKDVEIKKAERRIEELIKSNKKISDEKETFLSQALAQTESENAILRNYKQEIEIKTKLNNMYTDMLKENQEKCDNFKNQVEELKAENNAILEKCKSKEDEFAKLSAEHKAYKEKNEELISSLNSNLEKANKRLDATREENFSLFLEDLTPAAAEACRLIKNMPLVAIFRQMSTLNQEKCDLFNEKEQLSNELNRLTEDINKKNLLLEDLNLKHKDLFESNTLLTKDLQEVTFENDKLNKDKNENVKLHNQAKNENEKLKNQIMDLSTQVCFLLQKTRTSSEPFILSANLSKPLVTFKDIEELQANNMSLMKMVNELKDRLKNTANKKMEIDKESHLVDDLMEKISSLEKERDHNQVMIKAAIQEKDHYITLNKALKDKIASLELLINKEKENVETPKNDNSSSELQDALKKLEKQTENHIRYKKEKDISEQMLSETLADVRDQKYELLTKYEKALANAEFRENQLETMTKLNQTLRNQRAGLEERNEIYERSLEKQEKVILWLRTNLLETSNKASMYNAILQNLKTDYKFMKESHDRAKKERDMLRKERIWQTMFNKDLEIMKLSIEKAKVESSIRAELSMNAFKAEAERLKQKLQEQEEHNHEMLMSFEEKSKQSKNALAESEALVTAKIAEIESLKKQLDNTNKTIENLNIRILDMANASSDNKTSEWLLKVKDLEDKLEHYQGKSHTLQQNVAITNDKLKRLKLQKDTISEELLKVGKSYSDYKESAEENLKKASETEGRLRETIDQLKKYISNQTRNVNSIPSEKEDMSNEWSQSLNEKIAALDNANLQIETLTKAITEQEEKYAQKMVLHSNDITTIIKLREQLSSLNTELKDLTSGKIALENTISDMRNKFNLREKQLIDASEDSQKQLAELQQHNALLHEQLQTHDGNNSENFLVIIKQLNREMQILDTKYNAVLMEKNRMVLELEIMEKKSDEMKMMLDESKKLNTSMNESTAAMPTPEILAKINLLDALTDSNSLIRQEKDELSKRVVELTASCEDFNNKINEIKNSNSEVVSKMETVQTENNNLKNEIGRWRARVNVLVERVNKQSPEDWKRLQNERETLAKMLTVEKDNLKKINENLLTVKTEKNTIQEQFNSAITKLNSLTEEFNKQVAELNTLKENSSKMSSELISTKTSIAEMSETNTKLNQSLDAKKVEIEELSKREANVRRIAIKYKTEYQELYKTVESKKSGDPEKDASTSSDAEKQILKDQIAVYQDKTYHLEKQIEVMCENQDDIEKIKNELSEAQANMVKMNEANANLITELAETKNRFETIEKELKSNLQTLQLQCDEEITNIKREKAQVENAKRNAIAQLTGQLESLRQQIGHGQRGSDVSVKPSTSFEQRGTIENQQIHTKSLQSGIETSEITSSPSSSQNVIDFPTSSSTGVGQSCNALSLPPESTQKAATNPKSATVDNQSQSSPRVEVANTAHQMASSSSSNVNNSNSTVTTSHDNVKSENTQRPLRRNRQSIEQVDNSSGKRLKIQRAVESDLEYQVPTSSQREEDDCAIAVDSGDDENQCGNSCQEVAEEIEDDEQKVVQSVQSPENRGAEVKEEATSVASGSTSENNEVEVVSPDENQQPDNQEVRGISDSSEVRTEDSTSSHSPNSVQQISSVTGSAGADVVYEEGSDSVVPSMPSTPGEELLPGSSQTTGDKATESSEAEADTESVIESVDEDPMVSSQSSLPTSPNQIEETSEAVASSTAATPRGHCRRNQNRYQTTRASEYQLRNSRARSKK